MLPDLAERDFLFVWTKDGEYKVFNLHSEMKFERYLQENNWKHTATIDPSLWIEALIQHEPQDALGMIKHIRNGDKCN